MYQKIGILVVLASVLLSAGLLATPSFKVANAQGNETGAQGNISASIDADGMIKDLKAKHAALSALAEATDTEIISKLKDMDPKEAAKTILGVNIIRSLQEYKAVEESP